MSRHAERVEQARMVAVVGVRLIAVFFVCTSVLDAARFVASYLMYAQMQVGGEQWAWTAVGPGVAIGMAATLWFGAPWFARRVIRVRGRVCPGCGYALEGRPVERCPECALFLGDGFMDPPVDSGDGPDAR
jgi:hypothetical protein